jgi:hypothetical protein
MKLGAAKLNNTPKTTSVTINSMMVKPLSLIRFLRVTLIAERSGP